MIKFCLLLCWIINQVATDCQKPSLANANVSPSVDTIQSGQKYTVQCKDGFVGSDIMTCGSDNQFDKVANCELVYTKIANDRECKSDDYELGTAHSETLQLCAEGCHKIRKEEFFIYGVTGSNKEKRCWCENIRVKGDSCVTKYSSGYNLYKMDEKLSSTDEKLSSTETGGMCPRDYPYPWAEGKACCPEPVTNDMCKTKKYVSCTIRPCRMYTATDSDYWKLLDTNKECKTSDIFIGNIMSVGECYNECLKTKQPFFIYGPDKDKKCWCENVIKFEGDSCDTKYSNNYNLYKIVKEKVTYIKGAKSTEGAKSAACPEGSTLINEEAKCKIAAPELYLEYCKKNCNSAGYPYGCIYHGGIVYFNTGGFIPLFKFEKIGGTCPRIKPYPYTPNGNPGDGCCSVNLKITDTSCPVPTTPCSKPPCSTNTGWKYMCPKEKPYPYTSNGIGGDRCCSVKVKTTDTSCSGDSIPCSNKPCYMYQEDMCPGDKPYAYSPNGETGYGCCSEYGKITDTSCGSSTCSNPPCSRPQEVMCKRERPYASQSPWSSNSPGSYCCHVKVDINESCPVGGDGGYCGGVRCFDYQDKDSGRFYLVANERECKGSGISKGQKDSLKECADECQPDSGSYLFIYGTTNGDKSKHCYCETDSDKAGCTNGMEENSNYNLYSFKEYGKGLPTSIDATIRPTMACEDAALDLGLTFLGGRENEIYDSSSIIGCYINSETKNVVHIQGRSQGDHIHHGLLCEQQAPRCRGYDDYCCDGKSCGVGEGNCNDDDDCKEGLTCKANSCSDKYGFEKSDKCCQLK